MTAGQSELQRIEARALMMLAGIESPAHRRLDRAVLFSVFALLALFGVWAAATRMPEIAVAPGAVVTDEPVVTVQHLEGGIVDAVFVAEGEAIREGQALLPLSDTQIGAEVERLRAREASLRFREAHLRAFLDDAPLVLAADEPGFAALAADQERTHRERLRLREERLLVVGAAVDQRRAELAALAAQRDGVRRQLALQQGELALREQLLAQGLTTRIAVLETRRAVLAAQAEAERLEAMEEASARAGGGGGPPRRDRACAARGSRARSRPPRRRAPRRRRGAARGARARGAARRARPCRRDREGTSGAPSGRRGRPRKPAGGDRTRRCSAACRGAAQPA
jgi:multidrug efflux pump subunit AcrA (membrane-fusion protein)